jgi:hypothetical protein
MTDNRHNSYTGDDEVIQRNIEKSREVIEGRSHDDDAAPAHPDDPRTETTAPPGQWNVPIGGVSNMNSQGGSSKRHKPN